MISTPTPSSRILAERFRPKFAGKTIGDSTTPGSPRTESSSQSEYTRPENRPCDDAGIVPRVPQESKFGLRERQFLAKSFSRVPQPPLAAVLVAFNERFEGDLVDPFTELRVARSKGELLQEYEYYKEYYDAGKIAPEISAQCVKIPPKAFKSLTCEGERPQLMFFNIESGKTGAELDMARRGSSNIDGDENSETSDLE
jgi:hypothetical protein